MAVLLIDAGAEVSIVRDIGGRYHAIPDYEYEQRDAEYEYKLRSSGRPRNTLKTRNGIPTSVYLTFRTSRHLSFGFMEWAFRHLIY